ncbi:MAG TPA: AAA family ATPase [Bacillota bacterium]|nr:AAA family ATPase [Bacillota bacterium]
MMRWEWLIGAGIAVFIFLLYLGIDLTPFLFIVGAIVALRFFAAQGKGVGRNFEAVGVGGGGGDIAEVTFNDIGGQDMAKRELMEALDFVRDAESVQQLGIRPLRGILLTGPPGTGKTLMAKAAATYTDSVFIVASGSEFIEMYAGVGAQRVRQLFSRARTLAMKQNKTNAIIFIDEIEVLGGKRGAHTSHMEYDQTLNQLLVEMDGLKVEDGVNILIVAATNRADLLDEALLRPGRFDRQVRVDLPEKDGRKRILEIHTRNKPLDEEVDLDEIARETFGFSGAHLESLTNEAAILAYRKEKSRISQEELREAIDKVILGERLEKRPTDEELRRVAVHEAGHALVSEILRPESVASLTVTSRGKALGFMRPTMTEEKHLYTKDYILDQIAVCLGGAVAEETIYGGRSTGSTQDFEQANNLVGQMIRSGLSSLGIVNEDYLSQEKLHQTAAEILKAEEERVRSLVKDWMDMIKTVGDRLMEREKLSGEEFRELLIMNGQPCGVA